MNTTNSIRWLVVAAASMLLAACAASDSNTRGGAGAANAEASSSQEVLKQRAEQRWQYLIHHEAEKAYDYLTPGYRATISRKDYANHMNHRPVVWQEAKLHKLNCEQKDKCTVYMSITYTTRLPGIGTAGAPAFSPSKEDWLLLGNQWYYLPREGGGSLKKAK